jgi:prepilin-type N-terminal cleavage/methylation domain-containing protein
MRQQRGFTLVEIAIVLVIIGLLLGGILRGQELIQGARVRNIIDQQNGVRAAYFAFQDRFRMVPGDIGSAAQVAAVGNGVLASSDGAAGGNGQIAAIDSSTAFQNLATTGFLSCAVCTVAQQASSNSNSPTNVYGGVLQLVTDAVLADFRNNTFFTALASGRTNVKTGNQVPSNVLAEIDTKVDDGNPYTGNFRFSTWAPAGAPAVTQGNCAAGPTVGPPVSSPWNNGQAAAPGGAINGNCGGGTIIN